MNKLTPREKRTLALGLGFLILFSLFYWVLLPGWDEYERVNATLNKYKSSYQQTEAMARLEVDYQERLEAYEQAYAQLKERYYSGIDEKEAMLKFLSLVEDLTAGSGITIISKTTAVNEENGYRAIKVNLTLKGTSDQMTDLLLAYGTAKTTIRVDRLRVDRDERNRLLQLKLTVSTLIIGEEGVAK